MKAAFEKIIGSAATSIQATMLQVLNWLPEAWDHKLPSIEGEGLASL